MSAGGCAPILIRVAGLPASAVEELGSSLPAAVDAIAALESELAALRDAWVQRLYEAIGAADPEVRGFLLAVKRDAFNGRPLEPHRRHASWPRVEAVVGEAAARALAVEAALTARRARFEADYEAVVARHRQRLASWLEHPGFRCGLALASPVVARHGERLLRCPPNRYGRRERRLEATLARYVSRAACKLSPFASLTSIALAELADVGAPVELDGAGWGERSLVRVKRYLLDQYLSMLERYPPFRERLRMSLNDSACELDDGRLLYLRPSHWRLDEAGETLGWHRDSLVKARLSGPLVDHLRELIGDREPTYGELLAALEEAHPGEEVERQVGRLIEAGFLLLRTPWPNDEGYLERRLLEEVRRLPSAPEIDLFRRRLERLVETEEGYAQAAEPVESLAAIERSIGELWQAAAPLGGLSQEVGFGTASVYNVYQDVVRVPAADAPLATVDAESAHRALADAEPLVALSALFDPRHDLMLALADFAAERWSSRRVGLVALFEAAQPLWQDFVRYQVSSRRSREWPRTWDPRRLAASAELDRLRREIWRRLPECIEAEGDDQRIDGSRLTALLAGLPSRLRSEPILGCLFLQPASDDGSQWVLNRLKEGTGRFGSRYTPAMDAAARRRWSESLAARGSFDCDGERVDLLDVLCPQGDTLNVHAPQTPAVLTLPGSYASVEAERQRRLGDLSVEFPPDGAPAVRDAGGRRFLPVQLGVGYYDYMPTLVKFLCAFGPNELAAVFPAPRRRMEGGDVVIGRTRIGSVVLHRRSWGCATAELRKGVDGASDAAAFEAITRWRQRRGIPDLVFLVERVPHPIRDDRFQPQYIDFTSPVFVSIFRSALGEQHERVTLVEMLPTPQRFPRDAAGHRWAVELLLDSLALRAPRTREELTEPPGSQPEGEAPMDEKLNAIDQMEIEPLADEALEMVAGGKSSDGPQCCSCSNCSNRPKELEPVEPPDDGPIWV